MHDVVVMIHDVSMHVFVKNEELVPDQEWIRDEE